MVLIISISSAVALADSDTSSEPAGVFPVGFYDDAVYDMLASDTRATEYSTTDIYNLLYSSMRTENYNSVYSLPKIASYTNRIAQTLYGSGQAVPSVSLYSRVNSIYSNILDVAHAIIDGDSTNIPVGPGIRQMLYGIDSGGDWETVFDTSQDSRDLLQLIYGSSQQIHADGQNNSYYLSQLSSKIPALESSWTPFNITYNGWSSSLNGTYDTSTNPANAYDVTYYFKFTNNSGANTYRYARIFLNMINTGISDSSRVTIYAPVGNHMYEFPSESSYLMGRYLYLTDLPNNFASNQSFIIKIDFDYVSFTTTKNLTAEYLPDSFFSLLSNAELDLRLINRHFSAIDSDISAIRNVVASPDKVSAQEAQQGVESQVLDDFTGSGSESLKLSDVGGVKQVSGQAKSFLGSGSSSSNALSLFNVNGQGLWQWFSQTTADNLDTTSNNRNSSDDYYFYDNNMNDYYNGLGGSDAR